MSIKMKKNESEYKKYFDSFKLQVQEDFEKENKDLLLSQLLTALNEKDVDTASELYDKFKNALN